MNKEKMFQRKLNKIASLVNELQDEVEEYYGEGTNIFFESEGQFHIMDGDCEGSAGARQEHIRFSSYGYCRLGCGAW